MFAKGLFAGWADMDLNSHMKNTAFLDRGWLDLTARKIVAPPAARLSALQSLPQTDDYLELRSSLEDGAIP